MTLPHRTVSQMHRPQPCASGWGKVQLSVVWGILEPRWILSCLFPWVVGDPIIMASARASGSVKSHTTCPCPTRFPLGLGLWFRNHCNSWCLLPAFSIELLTCTWVIFNSFCLVNFFFLYWNSYGDWGRPVQCEFWAPRIAWHDRHSRVISTREKESWCGFPACKIDL